VNQYLYATTIAVHWPSKAEGIPYLQGRPIMEFEKVDRWILDPDTFWLSHQWLGGGGAVPPGTESPEDAWTLENGGRSEERGDQPGDLA
jgi:hypothetical protein